MSQPFAPGDFLVFQLEAGFALLRLLAVDGEGDDRTWHLAGYRDLFPDVDAAEAVIVSPGSLAVSDPHMALTHRAFESTQVARLSNHPLTASEVEPLQAWLKDPNRHISDRSVRLLLGLR